MDLSSIIQFLPGLPAPLRLALMGDGRPNNSAGDMAALGKAFAAEHAKNQAMKINVPAQGLDLPADFKASPPQSPPQAPQVPPPSPFSAAANSIVAQNNQPSVPLGSPPPSPMLPTRPMPPVQPTGLGVDPLPMAPNVPLPMARPPQAPQAPQAAPQPAPQAAGGPSGGGWGGFFANNTAMMRDPVSGDFIDPKAAAMAQANTTGPELVQKFMNMLHKGTS